MTVVRTSILSLALVTGVAFAAHAQSGSVAALPPGAAPAPAPAAVTPSAKMEGPNPGTLWSMQETQTRPVTPSGKMEGPNPGTLWSIQEANTGPVQPSPAYPGPRPN
jgi:hypothetical protein